MAGKLSQFRAIDPSHYIVYVGFVLILIGFSIVLRDDGFLTTRNLLNIVQQTTPITIMAVGMVFVLTAGEIDLSIGPIVARLGASRRRSCFARISGSSAPPPGFSPARRSAAINGLLVAYMRLPSFLVTLATMGFLAGVGALADRPPVGADHQRHVQQHLRRRQPLRRPFAAALDARHRRSSAISSIARRATAPMSTPSATAPKAPAPSASRSTASASR